MIRPFAIAVLSAWLAGCINFAPNVHLLSQFTPVKTPQTIHLREELAYFEKSTSWSTPDIGHGLLPGKYVSMLENHVGTLFYGEGRSVYRTHAGEQAFLHGGIWVPRLEHESPKMFIAVNRPENPAYESLPEGTAPGIVLSVALAEAVAGPSPEGALPLQSGTEFTEKLSVLMKEQLGSD